MRACVMERGYRTSQCMTILSLTESINIFVTIWSQQWKGVLKKGIITKYSIKKNEKFKNLKSIYRYFRKLAVYFCWIPS